MVGRSSIVSKLGSFVNDLLLTAGRGTPGMEKVRSLCFGALLDTLLRRVLLAEVLVEIHVLEETWGGLGGIYKSKRYRGLSL